MTAHVDGDKESICRNKREIDKVMNGTKSNNHNHIIQSWNNFKCLCYECHIKQYYRHDTLRSIAEHNTSHSND